VIMTDRSEFVEVQGTAEGKPFSRETIDSLLLLAQQGITRLFKSQREAVKALS